MMEIAEYQKLLPAGLALDRACRGSFLLGDEFEALDSRNGKTNRRLLWFLHPAADRNGSHEVPDLIPRLMAWFGERVGLRMRRVSLPLEIGPTPHGGLFVICHGGHGEPLSKLLAERSKAVEAPAARREIVEQVLAGLAELHAAHLVHGDVRPRNIQVRFDGPRLEPVVWLDAPFTGALAAWSAGRVEDPDSCVYRSLGVLKHAAVLSYEEDLRWLALTTCELALGGRQELLEQAGAASSVEEFWHNVRPAMRARREDRLMAIVALLLDQPVRAPFGVGGFRRLQPADANDVLRRMTEWDAARRRAGRRLLAGVIAAAVLSCASCAVLSIRVWHQAGELAGARRSAAEAGDQLTVAKAAIGSHESRIAELERQLDETVVREKNEELRAMRAAMEALTHRVAGLAPPPGDGAPRAEPNAEIGKQAKNAWQRAFTAKRVYDTNKAATLFESLAQNPPVADRIKQWRAGIDSLHRRAKPWLASDAELKRLHDAATRQPWEDWPGLADQRLARLNTAARIWVKCAAPSMDPDKVIANEADAEVQRILRSWYQALITRTDWTIQLISGASRTGAGYGTTRVVSVAALTSDSTGKHEWNSGDGHEYEAMHSYSSNDSARGTLAFQWRPGEAIDLTVEGARNPWAFGSFRPDIIFQRFEGPLAPWALNDTGTLTSGDDKTTLTVRVVECPGPPQGWNVEAAAGKKAKRLAKEFLGG